MTTCERQRKARKRVERRTLPPFCRFCLVAEGAGFSTGLGTLEGQKSATAMARLGRDDVARRRARRLNSQEAVRLRARTGADDAGLRLLAELTLRDGLTAATG